MKYIRRDIVKMCACSQMEASQVIFYAASSCKFRNMQYASIARNRMRTSGCGENGSCEHYIIHKLIQAL